MAGPFGHRYDRQMNWERRIKSEMVNALVYAGICGCVIAVAVWSLFRGDRLGAAVVGVAALPWALFAVMRLNNCRLIRTMVGKQGDTHA
jgi:formate/nitrite transporter FocA (FNT family)